MPSRVCRLLSAPQSASPGLRLPVICGFLSFSCSWWCNAFLCKFPPSAGSLRPHNPRAQFSMLAVNYGATSISFHNVSLLSTHQSLLYSSVLQSMAPSYLQTTNTSNRTVQHILLYFYSMFLSQASPQRSCFFCRIFHQVTLSPNHLHSSIHFLKS